VGKIQKPVFCSVFAKTAHKFSSIIRKDNENVHLARGVRFAHYYLPFQWQNNFNNSANKNHFIKLISNKTFKHELHFEKCGNLLKTFAEYRKMTVRLKRVLQYYMMICYCGCKFESIFKMTEQNEQNDFEYETNFSFSKHNIEITIFVMRVGWVAVETGSSRSSESASHCNPHSAV